MRLCLFLGIALCFASCKATSVNSVALAQSVKREVIRLSCPTVFGNGTYRIDLEPATLHTTYDGMGEMIRGYSTMRRFELGGLPQGVYADNPGLQDYTIYWLSTYENSPASQKVQIFTLKRYGFEHDTRYVLQTDAGLEEKVCEPL